MFVELLSLVVEPALREEGLGLRENRFVSVVNVAAVADNGLCVIVSRRLKVAVCASQWCDTYPRWDCSAAEGCSGGRDHAW